MTEISELIQRRLDILQISPAEAAKRAGLDRSYISDLIAGRKKSIRHDKVLVLAKALECDPAYLSGNQDAPKVHNPLDPVMEISGVCETGVWRSPQSATALPPLPRLYDARYPDDRQMVFLTRGHGADELGIRDGMVVLAIGWDGLSARGVHLRHNDVVVVRCARSNDHLEHQTCIMQAEVTTAGARLVSRGEPRHRPITLTGIELPDGAEILGLVVRAVITFL